ncbi:MAG TPA: lysylphosphatidylglycerol synthase transmembrane domain-containing protein [Thermoanaerobaculaceae bacterium]|nr:lysylphosphatidylglycerol synthase transmembrane domain-containing protein [Thermoanaerobaculaceae bacterium]
MTPSPRPEDTKPAAVAPSAPGGTARRLGWVTGVLLLGAVVLVVTHLGEERELVRLIHEAQPLWLLAAVALQVLTYVCAAAVWQRALVHRGVAIRLLPLVPLGLVKLFTDQVVPSAGVSGTLLVVRGLERRRVSRSDAVAAILADLAGYYVAYLLATLAALAVLWRHGTLSLVTLLPATALCVLVVALPAAILGLRRHAARHPARWLERLPGVREVVAALRAAPDGPLVSPRVLAETVLLQLAIFVLDALTLATTLRAVASPLGFRFVFASFVLASIVSTLAWVPGGVGTFDGSCVALLHLHGVSVEAALAATLLLRGLTFWLPMIPGFPLARREAAPPPPQSGHS